MNYIDQIKKYHPNTLKEKAIKNSMLKYIKKNHDDVLTRVNTMAHFTASSVILNQDFSKMLMIHHKIYDTWTWQGGHADGETDLLKVALKEAYEETGIKNLTVLKKEKEPIMRLDILPVKEHIKNGEFIANHLHLNVSFVFIASEKESLSLNTKETNDVRWIARQEINSFGNEPEITPIYHELITRADAALLERDK